jgi:hypothetical protein
MIDIRTYQEKKRGWWIEEHATIPCALDKQGLIVCFRREDAEKLMDETYPHVGKGINKRWYFNSTKDREIAEIDVEDRISANPQVLFQHFLPTSRMDRQAAD